jgi:hypothetical protein
MENTGGRLDILLKETAFSAPDLLWSRIQAFGLLAAHIAIMVVKVDAGNGKVLSMQEDLCSTGISDHGRCLRVCVLGAPPGACPVMGLRRDDVHHRAPSPAAQIAHTPAHQTAEVFQ